MKLQKIVYISIVCFALASLTFTAGCGGSDASKKKEVKSKAPSKYKKKKKKKESSVPVDMTNVGIGPIKEYKLSKTIDEEVAKKGEKIFKVKCAACHMPKRRLVGPAMEGIYERRNPAWVMNMILNPTEMILKDPIAVALLKEYNNNQMINQNITREEAEAMMEYFRTIE